MASSQGTESGIYKKERGFGSVGGVNVEQSQIGYVLLLNKPKKKNLQVKVLPPINNNYLKLQCNNEGGYLKQTENH